VNRKKKVYRTRSINTKIKKQFSFQKGKCGVAMYIGNNTKTITNAESSNHIRRKRSLPELTEESLPGLFKTIDSNEIF
jgi:hypothetical protein